MWIIVRKPAALEWFHRKNEIKGLELHLHVEGSLLMGKMCILVSVHNRENSLNARLGLIPILSLLHFLQRSHLLTTSPGEEWWCGPRGTHHHFKTRQRLGTKEALAGEPRRKATVSYFNGGNAFCTSSKSDKNVGLWVEETYFLRHLTRRCSPGGTLRWCGPPHYAASRCLPVELHFKKNRIIWRFLAVIFPHNAKVLLGV